MSEAPEDTRRAVPPGWEVWTHDPNSVVRRGIVSKTIVELLDSEGDITFRRESGGTFATLVFGLDELEFICEEARLARNAQRQLRTEDPTPEQSS